jgi:hypothetical protein
MIWLRRRLILWAAIVLGLPLAARMLHGMADLIEGRSGPGRAAERLRWAGVEAERLRGALQGRGRQGRHNRRLISKSWC